MNKKIQSVLQLYFVGVLILGMSACIPEPSDVTINTPADGAVLINSSLSIAATFPSGGDTPTVTLNGRNISQHTTYGATSVSADGADFAYAIKQGENVLAMTMPGKSAVTRKFVFDDAGPVVSFENVVRGTDNVSLTGIVSDPSGVSALSINEQVITVDANGMFSATLDAAETYGVLAEDDEGIKSYDHYVAPGATIDPIIRSTVDESLIDDLAPLIAAVMVADKEAEIFNIVNPILNESIFGVNVDVNLVTFQGQIQNGQNIGAATVNSLIVSPDSSSGTVTANISMTNPIIGVEIFIGEATVPLKINIRASQLNIGNPTDPNTGAAIRLETDAQDNLVVKFTETLPIDLSATTIEIANVDPVTNFILTNPVTNGIVAFVTDAIEPLLATVLPAVINAELASRLENLFLGLNIDDENVLFNIGIVDFGKAGAEILADLSAEYLAKNPASDDYALGVKSAASIDQSTGEVSIGGDLPTPSGDGQLNAAVSFDWINQLMLFAFETNLSDINIVGNQVVFGVDGVANATTSAGDLWIRVSPSVPELALSGDDTQADLNIDLDELNFSVSIRNGTNDGWFDALKLKVAVNLDAGFGYESSTSSIFLTAGDATPVVDVMEITTLGIGIPPFLANAVVNVAVPIVADILMEFLTIKLPIPADLPIQIQDISAVGDQNQYLNLSMDIDLTAILELLLGAGN